VRTSERRSTFRLGNQPGIDLTNSAYVVRSGRYISAIGKAEDGHDRLNGKMAMLREHRASARVLCLAYCTKKWPAATVETYSTLKEAANREAELKVKYGRKLPYPRGRFDACHHRTVLKRKLMDAAGRTPERGYIEAIFDVGEQLYRLTDSRFMQMWRKVGIPPGPWQVLFTANDAGVTRRGGR
jgi:hypothetical protein